MEEEVEIEKGKGSEIAMKVFQFFGGRISIRQKIFEVLGCDCINFFLHYIHFFLVFFGAIKKPERKYKDYKIPPICCHGSCISSPIFCIFSFLQLLVGILFLVGCSIGTDQFNKHALDGKKINMQLFIILTICEVLIYLTLVGSIIIVPASCLGICISIYGCPCALFRCPGNLLIIVVLSIIFQLMMFMAALLIMCPGLVSGLIGMALCATVICIPCGVPFVAFFFMDFGFVSIICLPGYLASFLNLLMPLSDYLCCRCLIYAFINGRRFIHNSSLGIKDLVSPDDETKNAMGKAAKNRELMGEDGEDGSGGEGDDGDEKIDDTNYVEKTDEFLNSVDGENSEVQVVGEPIVQPVIQPDVQPDPTPFQPLQPVSGMNEQSQMQQMQQQQQQQQPIMKNDNDMPLQQQQQQQLGGVNNPQMVMVPMMNPDGTVTNVFVPQEALQNIPVMPQQQIEPAPPNIPQEVPYTSQLQSQVVEEEKPVDGAVLQNEIDVGVELENEIDMGMELEGELDLSELNDDI